MSTFSQMFPPAPAFTERNLLDLSSKVYIITGATKGVGLALSKILYQFHATVYIGGRTASRCNKAIASIKAELSDSKGSLKPFIADLADLKTIRPAVCNFMSEEYRLDVLFLNAAVMTPPAGSKTKDGYDLEMGVNCLASFMLVSLLQPTMQNVASHFCHPNQSIRVVWVSSLLNMHTPNGGVQLKENGAPKQFRAMENYMQSKAGVHFLAHEFSRRLKKKKKGSSSSQRSNEKSHGNPHGVLHVTLNPGFMKTEMQHHAPATVRVAMFAASKGPKYGAYSELFAGLAPTVADEDYIIPWGRKGEVPAHIVESTMSKEGEKTVSARFYEWCEEQVQPFM